eukprot:3017020-Amphidinium_carterae.1
MDEKDAGPLESPHQQSVAANSPRAFLTSTGCNDLCSKSSVVLGVRAGRSGGLSEMKGTHTCPHTF